MEVAKVFTNGGSQAIRLPKTCRFQGEEVLINHIGNVVVLMPKDDPWRAMLDALPMFTDDFLREEQEDLPVQERESL